MTDRTPSTPSTGRLGPPEFPGVAGAPGVPGLAGAPGALGLAGEVQASFVATLVDEWVRAGVAHAVVCPGSRSTPLALALADRPEIVVHVRLDERSAAFVALGIGLATGWPAVLVTTSGTAAAEVHAAVVEADLSGVPLLVCTADRPPELHQVGAAQTIDQARLFGAAPRWFTEPGVADAGSSAWWRSVGSRMVAEATAGPGGPGPVHANLAFRDPLVGTPGPLPPGRPDGGPWHRVVPGVSPPDDALVASIASAARQGHRGLLVAGGGCGDPAAVLALSRVTGWPVLADPRSGLRWPVPGIVAAADGIVRSPSFVARCRPELVVRLGAPPASKPVGTWLAALAADGVPTILVDPWWRWTDPDRVAAVVARCDPTELCRAVVARLETGDDVGTALSQPEPPPQPQSEPPSQPQSELEPPSQPESLPATPWLAAWERAQVAAESALDGSEPEGGVLDEPALARHLCAALPAGTTLVVSSSMPIRDVESYGGRRHASLRVVANRGANGIDGVVSTAFGVALATGGPTVALVGDLAFLHDVSALVRVPEDGLRCTVVVADNGGGGIFSFLPQAGALEPAAFEQLFGTPQLPDVGAVAGGFGIPVTEVGTVEELVGALGGGTQGGGVLDGGVRVVRVRLPSRVANVERHGAVNDAIAAAVTATVRTG